MSGDGRMLLSALGERLGLPGLAFDEASRTCALAFDRRVTVHLALDERAGELVMFAVLGELAPARRQAACEAMLRGNYLWRATAGATLSLDPEQDAALLACAAPLAALDAGSLEGTLTRFVDVAFGWADRLRGRDLSPPSG